VPEDAGQLKLKNLDTGEEYIIGERKGMGKERT
jgi:hypothetical protein